MFTYIINLHSESIVKIIKFLNLNEVCKKKLQVNLYHYNFTDFL